MSTMQVNGIDVTVKFERQWTWVYPLSDNVDVDALKPFGLEWSTKRNAWYAQEHITLDSTPTPKPTPKPMTAKLVAVNGQEYNPTVGVVANTVPVLAQSTVKSVSDWLNAQSDMDRSTLSVMIDSEKSGKNRKGMVTLLSSWWNNCPVEDTHTEQTWEPVQESIVQPVQSESEIESRMAKVESQLSSVKELIVKLAQSQADIKELLSKL